MVNIIKPIVTIIIPAYNVENYIEKSLYSCANQTYTNIEIIIVDDGSSDDTAKIIEKYAESDDRFRFIKKKNGGVSSARNVALDHTKGEYVIFLDSDDWLELDTVSTLIEIANKYKDSFVICSRYIVEEYGEQKRNNDDRDEIDIELRDYALKNFDYKYFYFQSSCYKLFDTKIINYNRLRFCEDIFHGEDGLFVFQYLQYVNKVVSINRPLWNILERHNSATNVSYNYKKLTAINAAERMLECSLFPAVEKKIKRHLVVRTETVLIEAVNDGLFKNKSSIKYIKKKLRKNCDILMDDNCTNHEKCRYLICSYFPNILLWAVLKLR